MIEVIEWIDLVGLIAIAFLFVPTKYDPMIRLRQWLERR